MACGADRWLRDLPRLVGELEAHRSITVEWPYAHASEAFVAAAELLAGSARRQCRKLLIPQENGHSLRHEITMLLMALGQGCVGLLRHDDAARGALLLERLVVSP